MRHVTVLAGPERRRRWSDADKLRIVEAAFAPGACVADVARRFDVSTGLIYTWRRRAEGGVDAPGFVQAVIASAPAAGAQTSCCIVVDLPFGARASIAPSAPAALVADRKSVVSGKRVAVRVDLGGRGFYKKKKQSVIIRVEEN